MNFLGRLRCSCLLNWVGWEPIFPEEEWPPLRRAARRACPQERCSSLTRWVVICVSLRSLSLPAAPLPRCLSRAASMCFLGSPFRAHLLVFPLTCSDRRIVVRSFVPTTAFKFRYRTATTIGYSSSPRRRLKRRYRSSVTALYVRGFIARLCTTV